MLLIRILTLKMVFYVIFQWNFDLYCYQPLKFLISGENPIRTWLPVLNPLKAIYFTFCRNTIVWCSLKKNRWNTFEANVDAKESHHSYPLNQYRLKSLLNSDSSECPSSLDLLLNSVFVIIIKYYVQPQKKEVREMTFSPPRQTTARKSKEMC